ncbi:MAG: twin-arginine translocase subunit TatB [Asticcacaulis sp.]|nr:twin-arginine translocase subunit TatB [Asticcacaulis sp.]
MLPGIGGGEIVVIGVVALLVVGPKDLPKLLRQLGRFVGRMRAMADDFKTSFEDMARQSELDDLRKEVEALRSTQGLGDIKSEMTSIESDIHRSLKSTPTQPVDVTPLDAPIDPPLDPELADPQFEGLPPRGPDEVMPKETKRPLVRRTPTMTSESSDETAPAKPKRRSRAKKAETPETTDGA